MISPLLNLTAFTVDSGTKDMAEDQATNDIRDTVMNMYYGTTYPTRESHPYLDLSSIAKTLRCSRRLVEATVLEVERDRLDEIAKAHIDE